MTEPSRDPGGRAGRAIELSVEVPGTPEEVWEAIATGPGITSWFVPFEVETRTGGRIAMDFGSFGAEAAEVEIWEPPRRFAYRGCGDTPLAYEWLVEARDGGGCVVRLVNSGFEVGTESDGGFDGMSEGWQIFLQSLRLQLTYHRGQRARACTPTVTIPGPHRWAWSRLCGALGIAEDLEAGDVIRTSGDAPPLAGRVESVLRTRAATSYLLLVDEPVPGTGFISAEGDGEEVAASVYLYLYNDPADSGATWTRWLSQRFTPMTSPPSASDDPGPPG